MREDGEVAHATEGSRGSLLSNLTCLSEENIELQRGADNMRLKDDVIATELELSRGVLACLRDSRDRSEELWRRALEITGGMRCAVAEARLKGNRAVTELEACQGGAARLRDSLNIPTMMTGGWQQQWLMEATRQH